MACVQPTAFFRPLAWLCRFKPVCQLPAVPGRPNGRRTSERRLRTRCECGPLCRQSTPNAPPLERDDRRARFRYSHTSCRPAVQTRYDRATLEKQRSQVETPSRTRCLLRGSEANVGTADCAWRSNSRPWSIGQCRTESQAPSPARGPVKVACMRATCPLVNMNIAISST